jgi:hypothetical protein
MKTLSQYYETPFSTISKLVSNQSYIQCEYIEIDMVIILWYFKKKHERVYNKGIC